MNSDSNTSFFHHWLRPDDHVMSDFLPHTLLNTMSLESHWYEATTRTIKLSSWNTNASLQDFSRTLHFLWANDELSHLSRWFLTVLLTRVDPTITFSTTHGYDYDFNAGILTQEFLNIHHSFLLSFSLPVPRQWTNHNQHFAKCHHLTEISFIFSYPQYVNVKYYL